MKLEESWAKALQDVPPKRVSIDNDRLRHGNTFKEAVCWHGNTL